MITSPVNSARNIMPRKDVQKRGHKHDFLREARRAAGLTQLEVANTLGVEPVTVSRWERGENPPNRATLIALGRLYGVDLTPDETKELGMVPRGTVGENGAPYGQAGAPGARFPLSALLRLPDVRARLSAIQSELIELGATPEYEENVMRTLRDRAFLSRFAGGSADDQYTEAELLQAIDNIAESARRFLAGPTL